MRISDWSSDVCSSDLGRASRGFPPGNRLAEDSGCSAVIQSLLIANRGEIACRIICTARQMGIRTIAVYSDADATAPHCGRAEDRKSVVQGKSVYVLVSLGCCGLITKKNTMTRM